MAEGETTEEAVSRIVKAAGGAPIVCILGSTSFNDADSEALVKALAEELTATVGEEAILVTGGMAGVQQVFATMLATLASLALNHNEVLSECISIVNPRS